MESYDTGIFIEGYMVEVKLRVDGSIWTASIDGIIYVSIMAGSLSEVLHRLKTVYLRVREVSFTHFLKQFNIEKAQI